MVRAFEIQRFGDLYVNYYNNVFEKYYYYMAEESKNNESISKEIRNLEREVLKDLSGKSMEIGLSDYIAFMAKPAWIWNNIYDFPPLYSLEYGARKEIQDFFNFDSSLPTADDLELKVPDFEKLSLPTVCENANFTNYCKLAKNLPDLQTTMHFMNLAKFPLEIETGNVEKMIK